MISRWARRHPKMFKTLAAALVAFVALYLGIKTGQAWLRIIGATFVFVALGLLLSSRLFIRQVFSPIKLTESERHRIVRARQAIWLASILIAAGFAVAMAHWHESSTWRVATVAMAILLVTSIILSGEATAELNEFG